MIISCSKVRGERLYGPYLLQGLLMRLVTIVHEEHTGNGAEYFPSRLSNCIIDVLARIEQHYSENLRMGDIAESLGYSEAHLSRLFRKQLGVGFSEYLSRVRMRHVCDMLSTTESSISEIAISCGYCNGDYLSARFRMRMGLTPREFRQHTLAHS